MNDAPPAGVVVDTMVISWLFDDRPNPVADRVLIGPVPVLLAFHTVMELRFGAMRAGWGELRRRRLERGIAELAVLQPARAMCNPAALLASHERERAFHWAERAVETGQAAALVQMALLMNAKDFRHAATLLDRGGHPGAIEMSQAVGCDRGTRAWP